VSRESVESVTHLKDGCCKACLGGGCVWLFVAPDAAPVNATRNTKMNGKEILYFGMIRPCIYL